MPILGADPGPRLVAFTAVPGHRINLPADTSTPLDYFQQFVPDALFQTIVDETNLYARQWIDSHTRYLLEKPKSRVHVWIKQGQTNVEEMKAFIAVVVNMGLIKLPDIPSYWCTQYESQSHPWFTQRFNRDRFQLLLKFLHFANNDNLPAVDHPDHKTYKIKHVFDQLNAKFLKNYMPHEDVSIDESMVGYRGKTPHLRQYMPNKHHARFGIKLWAVCDASTQYTKHMEIYKGAHAAADNTEDGVTYNLVFRLLRESDLLNQGYHIGMDNYFSSPKLFLELYKQQTTATGTVRTNRKGLPKAALKTKLANHQVCERRKGDLLCTVYQDNKKKPVLLSTTAKAGQILTRNARGKEITRPRSVIIYNLSMGGVDVADARLYAYLSERRTMKWTKKLFFAVLGRAILNSFIVYNEHTTRTPKLTRKKYNIVLLEALMGDYRPSKNNFRKRRSNAEIQAAIQPQNVPIQAPDHDYTPAPKKCILTKIGNGIRRKCMHKHEKDKRTVWQCDECQVTLCPGCFLPYHQERNIRMT